MKIKCHLSTLMGKNKLTIKDVCEKTGLARNTISFLYHEKVKRIDFETLVKLCTFFDCKVEDILEFEKE
ncbi:MAG: Cro/Cl family transcriptional regulator [Clostridiales bacterium 43-6]|nr:MAG: Cro/Cl family transcriptional regulator [Clostridiales bacterium 43-6]